MGEVERAVAEAGVPVRWSVFPLHPETPEEGLRLDQLFAGRGVDLAAMQERVRTVARALGLPYGARDHTYNSLRAQRLGKWAEAEGRGGAFRRGVFEAYFVAGRNIARSDELLRVAVAAGLPPVGVEAALAAPEWAAAVEADWERARSLGIRAVPTHRFRGRSLAGWARQAALEELLAP